MVEVEIEAGVDVRGWLHVEDLWNGCWTEDHLWSRGGLLFIEGMSNNTCSWILQFSPQYSGVVHLILAGILETGYFRGKGVWVALETSSQPKSRPNGK